MISHGGWDFAPLECDDWIVLQGADDPHNDVEEVTGYWAKLLPRTRMESVQGAGRFMTSSHPELIVQRLEQLL